jgi:hypothetical protein
VYPSALIFHLETTLEDKNDEFDDEENATENLRFIKPSLDDMKNMPIYTNTNDTVCIGTPTMRNVVLFATQESFMSAFFKDYKHRAHDYDFKNAKVKILFKNGQKISSVRN